MNDESTKLLMFLLIFWSGIIIANIFFNPWVSQFTDADLGDLTTGVSADETPFERIIKLMTFQVTGDHNFWLAVILDLLLVVTIYVAYMALPFT